MKNLKFHYQTANESGEKRHAQEAIDSLGITYEHAAGFSMGDCWMFWGCSNVPLVLPEYITEMKDEFTYERMCNIR